MSSAALAVPRPFFRTATIEDLAFFENWDKGGFLFNSDSLLWMKALLDAYGEGWMDGVFCDPPYGIEFLEDWDSFDETGGGEHLVGQDRMGGYAEEKGFRSGIRFVNQTPDDMLNFQAFSYEWARLAYLLCKPGARLVAFCAPQTYHYMACGVAAAGWQVFDKGAWVYWSGMTKSHDYGKAARRRYEIAWGLRSLKRPKKGEEAVLKEYPHLQAKFKADLDRWVAEFAPSLASRTFGELRDAYFKFMDGKGHGIKPAHEPFVMARKPSLEPHHLSGFWLNIDECRIPYKDKKDRPTGPRRDHLQEPFKFVEPKEIPVHYPHSSGEKWNNGRDWLDRAVENGETVVIGGHPAGRFPANVVVDDPRERDHFAPPEGRPQEMVGSATALGLYTYDHLTEDDYLNPPPPDKPKEMLSHDFSQHAGSMMVKTTRNGANKNGYPYVPHPDGRTPTNVLLPSQIDLGEGQTLEVTAELLMDLGAEYLREILGFGQDDDRGRFPINLFQCPKPAAKEKGSWNEHPTIKPETMVRWVLKLMFMGPEFGRPGQIVLDPFCGSGPVPKVAEELGLRWIAGDMDTKSCGWTVTRIRRLLKERESKQEMKQEGVVDVEALPIFQ